MFESLPTPLNNVATIVAVISGAVAVGVYVYLNIFKSNKQFSDETISTLKENVSALQGRVEILETESKDKDREIAKLGGKVDALEKENKHLRDTLALRDPEFTKVMTTLSEQLPRMVDSIDANTSEIKTINDGANSRYGNIENCLKKLVSKNATTGISEP